MGLLDSLEHAFRSVRLFIQILFLRIQLFVLQQIEYRTSPSRSNTRTILLIGDAVALGVGDSLGKCGLVTRLPALLRARAEDTRLRLYWHTVTAAKLGSKAKDWMPGSRTGFFENTLVRGGFKSADVVVVLLGVHDDLVGDGDEVVNALERVVEGVVRLGKQCVVGTLPNEFPYKSKEHACVRQLNAEMKQRLMKVGEENSGDRNGTVCVDVEMAKVYAMGNDVLSIENDFIALNSAGYRLLASEVFDSVVSAAKKVEWKHWKHKLAT